MKKLFILLFLFAGLVLAKDVVDIKVNQPGQLVIEVSIDSTWISSNDQLVHSIPRMDTYFQPGFPVLPYYQEVFIGVPANADVNVFTDNRKHIGSYNPENLGPETAKGIDFELPLKNKFDGHFPEKLVKITQVENVNRLPSSKIEVFPFSIQNGQLFVTENISIQISWDTNIQSYPVKEMLKTPLKELNPKTRLNKPTKNVIPAYQFSNNIAKIVVDESGWYKLPSSKLIENGIDLNSIDPSTIHLWYKNDEMPMHVETGNDGTFNSDDLIVFYGKRNPSPEGADYDNNFYTKDNVYWLTWGTGDGLRFEQKDVSQNYPTNDVYTPEYFIDSLKFESDQRYFRLNYNNKYVFQTWDVTDHLFMAASMVPGGNRVLNFNLNDPVNTPIDNFSLRVLVYGVTYYGHDLTVNLNNNELFSTSWNGQTSHIAQNSATELSSEILLDGPNELLLQASKDNPAHNDRLELNWFEIIYPRFYRAADDYLKFYTDNTSKPIVQYNIQNVSSTDILLFKDKEEILTNTQMIQDVQNNLYTLTFQDSASNSRYELIAKDQLVDVKSLSLEMPIQNQLEYIQNSYIAICPDSFTTVLQPLLDVRNGVAVDVEDIYRQYNGGVLSPYAIKQFISDLYHNNNLEHVLIAMQNNLYDQCCSQSVNQRDAFIPAMHIFVYQWGDLVSDYWYSLIDGDDFLPDVSIGRFPAANSTALQEMVNKTLLHYNRDYEIRDNTALLIGGAEKVFKTQSEALADNFIQNGTFLSRIYVSEDTTSNFYYFNTDTLLNHFNSGLSYVNFLGHGGAYIWSDAGLLDRDAINNEIIRNGNNTPFVTSMTCFTGDISRENALGRYMLTNPNGGALGWYGSAGPGWQNNDYYMVKPLQNLLLSEEDLTIGELINKSKLLYYSAYSDIYRDICLSQLHQFNIIGDPAVKLKKTYRDKTSITPADPEPGESIVISSKNSPIDSVYYQIFLPNNYSSNYPKLLAETLPTTLTIPDTSDEGMHSLNIAYKYNNNLINSSQLFSVAGSYISVPLSIPTSPTICDSIGVIVEVQDRNGISSVKLIWDDEYWADMIKVDSTHYSLESLIMPQAKGTILNLVCQVIDKNNDTTFSKLKFVEINEIPNILPKKGEFTIDDEINLNLEIESTTTTPVDATIELFKYNIDKWELIGSEATSFNNRGITSVQFPGYYPVGVNLYRAVTSTNLSCNSSEEANDDTLDFYLETSAFWITPELGSTADGINHSKIGIKNIDIDIPSGVVASRNLIHISQLNEISLQTQPDFEEVQIAQDYLGINIILENDIDYNIAWKVGSEAINSNYKLYGYIDNYKYWLPINHSVTSESSINILANGDAQFAYLDNKDTEKPIITAKINGQKYYQNSYINTNPIIEFDIYDKNGIDSRPDSVEYWINNIQDTSLNSEINGSGNNVNISVNPTFTEARTSMSVLARDAAGNHSDTLNLAFIVSDKMELIDYGNYPNPFSDNTIFAYDLTEAVEEISFTIYTVEGRKIRQLDYTNIYSGPEMHFAGYHEIEWDGKNQDGQNVANGNYFYLIRAKNDEIVVEKNGKIVKIK